MKKKLRAKPAPAIYKKVVLPYGMYSILER